MCQAASMILLQDKVLIGRITNSHSEILRQHKIEDKRLRPDFVKIEIVPLSNNYNSPLKHWNHNIDQDYIPDWYVSEYDEKRARGMLKTWYEYHIIGQMTDAANQEQTAGNNSTQTAGDRSIQEAGDESTQKTGRDSIQTAGIDAVQIAMNDSIQTAGDRATQDAGDDSIQTAGIDAVQIIRYHIAGAWKVKTRIITKEQANKSYKFFDGDWHLIK